MSPLRACQPCVAFFYCRCNFSFNLRYASQLLPPFFGVVGLPTRGSRPGSRRADMLCASSRFPFARAHDSSSIDPSPPTSSFFDLFRRELYPDVALGLSAFLAETPGLASGSFPSLEPTEAFVTRTFFRPISPQRPLGLRVDARL